MLFRIFIANADARQIAEIGQSIGISGSVTGATFGFGAWGIESTVIVEMGGTSRDDVARFTEAVFRAFPAEEAVYVIEGAVGSAGRTWYRDGRIE
jgi:hypothetical protein